MSTNTQKSDLITTDIIAGVKRRVSERGVRYDVTFVRQDADGSDDQSFLPVDLLRLSKLAQCAYDAVRVEYSRDCDALGLGWDWR